MLIYQSQTFREAATKLGHARQISNLVADLERMHDATGRFNHYTAHFFNKRISNARMIAEKRTVDGREVFILLDLVLRKDEGDYLGLADDPSGFGKRRFSSLVTDSEISTWMSTIREGGESHNRDSLPPELLTWLHPPGWDGEPDEIAIYESREWVQEVKQARWKDYRILLHRVLEENVENKITGFQTWSSSDGVTVLACQLVVKDTQDRHAILLLRPFRECPSTEQLEQVRTEAARHLHVENETWRVPHDSIARISSRSYPAYMVADRDLWLEVIAGGSDASQANLSLSGEEMGLLLDLSNRATPGSSLPVFIDGRAGSGKSTMLLYLFADYCHRLRQDASSLPIYLTYNQALLDVARKSVLGILRQHHRFVLQPQDPEFIQMVGQCFQPFQEFLLGLLPEEDLEQFRPGNRIGFGSFKREFRKLRTAEARRVTPEVCWHVIRSFIKGYDPYSILEPDEYARLPRNDRSVSAETFEQIYRYIWSSWYRDLTAPGTPNWDDQDLIRHILNTRNDLPARTAVFCDEAQDFTRLELGLVMRLSVLGKYDLGYGVNCLPFAFAGDPFQTLNPTGFRWKALEASFHDVVIRPLDPEDRLNLTVARRELQFNYRSAQPIVGLTNIIQLWRRALFEHSEVSPQESWLDRSEHVPLKFILDREVSAEDLKRILAETVIIVPCDEDEEASYVASDPVLSQVVEGGQVPKNVFSPVACKGLEFGRVVLYKFGDACDTSMWQLLTANNSRDETALTHEYFLNKLYVGATRATREMYIIDTQSGDEHLWSKASSISDIEEICREFDTADRERWNADREDLFHLRISGTREDILRMREDNPLSIAEELESQGRAQDRPDLLRRASRYYVSLQMDRKAALCEAWALYHEGEYVRAGQRFLAQDLREDAWRSFWSGSCWRELLPLYEKNPDPSRESQAALGSFRVSDRSDLTALYQFAQVLDRVQNYGSMVTQRQWQDGVAEFATRIINTNSDSFETDQWNAYAQTIMRLALHGFRGLLLAIGTAAFRAGSYASAVEHWTKAGDINSKEYFIARAETASNVDEQLIWLSRAERDDTIVEVWGNSGYKRESLSADSCRAIAGALERRQKYDQAVELWLISGNVEKAKYCLSRLIDQGDRMPILVALSQIISHLLSGRHRLEAIQIFRATAARSSLSKEAKRRLQADILQSLCAGDFGGSIVGSDYQVYDDFMKDLLGDNSWRSYTTTQRVGLALERIGSHVPTLRFYEDFINNSHDPATQQFARERWVVVKRRQAMDSRNQRARDQLGREAEARRHDWGIDARAELPAYPVLQKDADYGVQGLPTDASMQVRDDCIVIKLGKIEINVGRTRHKVRVEDSETWETVLFDPQAGTIDGKVTQQRDGDSIEFESSTADYRGRFILDQANPVIEFRLGDSRPMKIDLKQAFNE